MTKTNDTDMSVESDKFSADILLGAYLINHLRSHCENCGTFNTPQWRKGWFSTVLNRSVLLCNACGLKYHKNQFCPHCMFVYSKEHDRVSNGWLVCSFCTRWVHNDCEVKHGTYFKTTDGSTKPYACPDCKAQKVQTSTTLTHNPPQFSGIKFPNIAKSSNPTTVIFKQPELVTMGLQDVESPDHGPIVQRTSLPTSPSSNHTTEMEEDVVSIL